MHKHARFIAAVIARRFRSRAVLELENLALRHQLHVLRRQRPARPRLITVDRLLWVWLYRLWPRCLDTIVLLLKPEMASARGVAPSSIYAIKFVCGRQAPTNVTPPVEPPVKPGNYATKVNVELLSPNPNKETVATWNVSLDGDGVSAVVPIDLSQLQTVDFTVLISPGSRAHPGPICRRSLTDM